MDAVGEIVVGLLILTGLAGILIPILPGLILVAGSVVVWAFIDRSGAAWTVAAIAVALTVAGTVFKFLVPGRRLTASGGPALDDLVRRSAGDRRILRHPRDRGADRIRPRHLPGGAEKGWGLRRRPLDTAIGCRSGDGHRHRTWRGPARRGALAGGSPVLDLSLSWRR